MMKLGKQYFPCCRIIELAWKNKIVNNKHFLAEDKNTDGSVLCAVHILSYQATDA
jgi:hypothetical protein